MYKQTIVIRADLKMHKGKACGQCSHASVSAYEKVRKNYPDIAKSWITIGQKKVVLKVASEEELFEFFQAGKDAGIPCELIRDAGRTQLEPGSITCFGAGPWDEEELDSVFGKLKLL
jgi:PTH2 family peptidyl-tRNA hydrolase